MRLTIRLERDNRLTTSDEDPFRSEYLGNTTFIDGDNPSVVEYTKAVVGDCQSDVEKARALFYAVRDDIRYDPYRIDLKPEAMRASSALERRHGFCITKALLLAATARLEGIPTRLGFADVKNHLNTDRLKALMETDVFAFHGYTELFLNGKWVKATPAFNGSLCERFNVAPLEFDGEHDAMLQQANREGEHYMEYVHDHGLFADLPYDLLIATWNKYYPKLMAAGGYSVEGEFETDAEADATT